jgi:TRAP-type C4-dicarboxylate transport system permease small subunit
MKGGHIVVDVISMFLNNKTKLALNFIMNILLMILSVFLAVIGYQEMIKSINLGQTTPSAVFPLYLGLLALPLGFILMALGYFAKLFDDGKSV